MCLVDKVRAAGAHQRSERVERFSHQGDEDGADPGAGFHGVQSALHGAHLRPNRPPPQLHVP